jgi:hypothetical protein
VLPTTSAFDDAIDANTTEVDARVRIYREYNAIADNITVSSDHDPFDPRFDESAVVNIRNPKKNGVAYGPVRDAFFSDNPVQSFRALLGGSIDAQLDSKYYIPKLSANTTLVNLTVDYSENFEMNQIQVRYENSKTLGTYHDSTINVYIYEDGGASSLIFTGTMNDTGVTTISHKGGGWQDDYSAAGWEESSLFTEATARVRKVRVQVIQGSSGKWQPRLMYVGGIHALDVSGDLVSASVTKSAFERDELSPFGQPSANTCSVKLDNTGLKYRFGPDLDRNYFLKHQRMTVDFGVNTKYGGGADTFLYVPAGAFYIDSYSYSESDLTVSISGRDFAQQLQERMCGNYAWKNKSLKHIVSDVLARSGVSPRDVIFDFGVVGNANEANLRKFTWASNTQTLWDFLSTLAASELGTVFIDEEENLVFTDRLDIDVKFNAGVQYSISDYVNLESIEEQSNVVANKINVSYETLEVNSTQFNPVLVVNSDGSPSYSNGQPQYVTQALWRPSGEDAYLGSAILLRRLNPTDAYMYITEKSAIQITRKEGEVLIGDEFITYNNREILSSGDLKLTISNRDNRETLRNPARVHLGVKDNYNTDTNAFWARSVMSKPPTPGRKVVEGGFRKSILSGSHVHNRVIHTTSFGRPEMNYLSKYKIYGMRFNFRDTGFHPRSNSKYRQDDIGGMFINLDSSGYGIFFEISNPDVTTNHIAYPGSGGNVRAYKSSRHLTILPLPPTQDLEAPRDLDVRYKRGRTRDGIEEFGTSIDITVIQKENYGKPDDITWFINGNAVGTFQTAYSASYLRGKGYNNSQAYLGSSYNERGLFGAFIRGSTVMDVEYIYATNDDTFGGGDDFSRPTFRPFDNVNGNRVDGNFKKSVGKQDYFYEFASPVHEAKEFEVDHDTFPNVYARTINSNEGSISVFNDSHTPFSSKLLVANTSRIGTQLNDTLYLEDGTTRQNVFMVYGVGIVKVESEDVETKDSASIRRYGVEEFSFSNPWVNSKNQATSLANYIRKFWKGGQQNFEATVFPNPALQVRDRVSVSNAEKGFVGGDTWFVNGITLSYDGGLTSTVDLVRFEDYPTGDSDYRDSGGINIV